jgi:hypothetical protein
MAKTRSGKKKTGTTKRIKPRRRPAVEAAPEEPQAPLIPGPRKKRPKGPKVRFSSHKIRSRWFQTRASWPVREAPVSRLVRERTRVEKALAEPSSISAEWECVGPTNIGGRITALACDPKHPERIWAGAAGGGVWQSRDAGHTWQSCWNDQDILNIGSIAIDPSNPDIIYCGTGEANLSLDSYPGVGLYKSRDAGRTWQLLASVERTGIPRHLGVIAIDPFNSQHILLGGVGYAEVSQANDFGGLYTSFDGGVTWARQTFVSTQNYWCHQSSLIPRKKEQSSQRSLSKARAAGFGALPTAERIGYTSKPICLIPLASAAQVLQSAHLTLKCCTHTPKTRQAETRIFCWGSSALSMEAKTGSRSEKITLQKKGKSLMATPSSCTRKILILSFAEASIYTCRGTAARPGERLAILIYHAPIRIMLTPIITRW